MLEQELDVVRLLQKLRFAKFAFRHLLPDKNLRRSLKERSSSTLLEPDDDDSCKDHRSSANVRLFPDLRYPAIANQRSENDFS